MRAVLGVRVYRRLLSVYALNEAAWSIGLLALSLLVYRRTGSAWASTAFFLASQFAPAFVSPSLVARLERLVAGRVLAGLYATQGAIFALLAASPSHFALVPLLALSLAAGIFGLAARPLARATVTSVLVPAGLLREGNAATNVAFSVSILLGPIVGGAIVAAAGTAVALLVVAGMFVAAALVAATVRGLASSARGSRDTRARVRTAIAATGREALIRKLLLFQAIALVFLSMSVPVEVVFAQHSLHVGAGGYGALLSAWGLGAIVGSAVYARWRALPGWLLIGLSTVAVGVGFVVMAAAPTLWVAVVGSAVGGVGNGIEPVVERTVLQERVEQRWLALTLSLNESMFQAMPGLGFVLGGGIAALAGARTALAVGGIGAIVIGALAPAVLRSGWGSQGSPGEDGVEPTPTSGPRRAVEDHRVAERG
jgi:MFS family permease